MALARNTALAVTVSLGLAVAVTSGTSGPQPQDSTRAFGQYATYGDGLSVNVSEPKAFTPSPGASFEPAPTYVRFTVTIVNRTGKTVDLSLFYASLQSADEVAGVVFDSEQGLEPGPFTKLLRGSAARWDVAYGVQDPDDLALEVIPGGAHSDPVTFSQR